MSETTKYRDNPKPERQGLTQETNTTWGMRGLLFVCIVLAMQLAYPIRDYVISHHLLPLNAFFSGLLVALALGLLIVFAVYQPILRWRV